MQQTIIYSLLLLFLLVYMIYKRKNIVGITLYALYFGESVFSIIGIKNGLIEASNVSLFPYLVLIFTYVIFFSPFVSEKLPSAEYVSKDIPPMYILFSYFYIICAFLAIITYLPVVRRLVESGLWANNYKTLVSGDLIFPDSNPILHFANLISGYFKVLALILAFAMMRRKTNNFASILLILAATGKTVCSAIYISSRGAIVVYTLLVFAIYAFFFRNLARSKQFIVSILLFFGFILIIPFVIEVTVDRFGTQNAINSIIDYLGKAPVVFNYGVFTSEKAALGRFAWGLLRNLPFSPSDIGGNWGTSFYTFVGYIFIDWGLFGLSIISILLFAFWSYYLKREVWRISDIFLLFSHLSFLLNGVFVIGRDYYYIVIMTIVIYFLIKVFCEQCHYRIGHIEI